MFDATYDQLEDIALDVLEMYSRPKRSLEEVEKELSTLKDALQKSTTKEAELKKIVSISASTESMWMHIMFACFLVFCPSSTYIQTCVCTQRYHCKCVDM